MYFNVYILSISIHMHKVTSILIAKAQRKSNQILIGFSILCHVFHLIFDFVPSELLNVKIEESKSNQILNWISIGTQFFAMCPFNFLIYVASELMGAKTEKFKSNYILNHICKGTFCSQSPKVRSIEPKTMNLQRVGLKS